MYTIMEKWWMSNRILVTLLGFFVFGSSQAQIIDLEAYKSQYAGHHLVRLNREKTIKIDIVKGEPKARTTVSEDIYILNGEGASMLAEFEIISTSFENLENIDAYAIDRTKKSGKKYRATNFKTRDAEKEASIFHDDNVVTSFLYPGLKEGMVRHLGYELNHLEYKFPYTFNFFHFYPTEKTVFTIDHDTSIHLLKYDYNFDGIEINFEETVVKNRRIWKWTCSKLAVYKRESYAPDFLYYLPGVAVQISHYNLNNKRINVLGNIQDLVNWYAENVDHVLSEDLNDELKNIAVSVTEGIEDEKEKVKAIYYWVQDNIKYIAFEAGMSGLVPRKASEVCKKRFGDCKDMAVIIYKLLEALNINAKICWVGTTDIPFKYSEFPSTMVDNHMIAVYYDGDKPIFLDATASNQPMNLPSIGIKGKEALVYKHVDDYKIELVPVPKPEETQIVDNVTISIDGRKIIGTSNSTLTGYYKWIVQNDLLRLNDKTNTEKTALFYDYGNNSFKVTRAEIGDFNDREKPLVLDFDFEVENYALSVDDEVYVNMIISKDIHKEDELKATRQSPFMMDFLSKDNYHVALNIPDGMKVKHLPEDINYTSEYVSFSIKYEVADGQVKMSIINLINFIMLKPQNFQIWNDYVKAIDKALSSSVVLIKK